jgi:tetratricopeptide (TPR) repeat protein
VAEVERLWAELDAPPELGGAPVVSLSGVGGIGKTTLLRAALRDGRRPRSAIVAWADERDGLTDAAAVAGVFARRLAATLGPGSHTAQALARRPAGGPNGAVPRIEVTDHPAGHTADVTEALIRDVNAAGAAGRQVVLVLDSFEGVRAVAGPWLLEVLLGGRSTPITGDLRVVVSGREPLQRTDPRWLRDWGDRIANIDLEPFTLAETEAFLAPPEPSDCDRRPYQESAAPLTPEEVGAAHRLTGGLPVWLALWRRSWHGAAGPPDLDSAEHVQAVVDRFLLWWDDAGQLRWVRTAWVPRRFNLDVLRIILGPEAEAAFEWLTRQASLVRGERGYWRFHEVVRTALRRDALQRAPDELRGHHDALAGYWSALGAATGQPGAVAEALYHQILGRRPADGVAALCRAYVARLDPAGDRGAGEVVAAGQAARNEAETGPDLRALDVVEGHWAALQSGDGTAEAAARDSLLALDLLPPAARAPLLARRLAGPDPQPPPYPTVAGGVPGERPAGARWGGPLIRLRRRLAGRRAASTPEGRRRAAALVEYADAVRLSGDYAAALPPLTEALALEPANAAALASRGETFRALDRPAEAIADLSAALRLTPDDPWVWAARATAHLAGDAPEKALADADRAIKLDAGNAWALAVRGLATGRIERGPTPAAVADLRRALALDPNLTWAREEWEAWQAAP